MKNSKKIQIPLYNKKGFSLIELMFSVGILSFVLVGMVAIFILAATLSNVAGEKTLILSQCQNKIEEIRNHDFDNILTDYASGGTPGDTFNLELLNGTGDIYIDSTNSELLILNLTASWENKPGRSSSVSIVSMLTKR